MYAAVADGGGLDWGGGGGGGGGGGDQHVKYYVGACHEAKLRALRACVRITGRLENFLDPE